MFSIEARNLPHLPLSGRCPTVRLVPPLGDPAEVVGASVHHWVAILLTRRLAWLGDSNVRQQRAQVRAITLQSRCPGTPAPGELSVRARRTCSTRTALHGQRAVRQVLKFSNTLVCPRPLGLRGNDSAVHTRCHTRTLPTRVRRSSRAESAAASDAE